MSMRENTCGWAVISLILVIMCGGAFAGKTIYVDDDGPADFNNIQAAINDSNDGDKIIVRPGLYKGSVRFQGKNITLTSTNPGDFKVVAATVLDNSALFVGNEDPNCMLIGFKINGWISGVDYGIDPTGENHTHATISHCLFTGRTIYGCTTIDNCDGTINNCVIADNRPSSDVIGSAVSGCHGLIKSCTVAGNMLGVNVEKGGRTRIENCIIYNNISGQIGVSQEGTVDIWHSDVEGGPERIFGKGVVNWGTGNVATDPFFVRAGDWFEELNGDYHLKSQAGRYDPNTQSWIRDDVTSPCIDTGDPNSIIGNEPFPNGGIVNMGAYGGTAEASKSYFGEPVCETIIAGDINGDCKVDFADFSLMAENWLKEI